MIPLLEPAGTGTRDRRERGDDLHLELEGGAVNISDTWRSPISSFRCASALVAYCPFSFCASSSACLKSFLIERHMLLTVESGILRLADFGVARKSLFLLYLRCRLSGSNSVGRMPASRCTLYFL